MITTHLSMIIDMHKRYGADLFTSNDFKQYFDKCMIENTVADLCLSMAYEAKDFGGAIEPYSTTDKILELLAIAERDVLAKKDAGANNGSDIFYVTLSKGIFSKYFVFASKKEYLNYFKELKAKGYSTDSILSIFANSFERLRESLLFFNSCLSLLSFVDSDKYVMFTAVLNKEVQESYTLLESLGDPESYPNIDSSYVYIDQLNNPDFYRTASSLLFSWCVKNDS